MSKSKDLILNVALKVFGRLGVYKTTMTDIAKASKKGRRTIYQYFKSKEDIYMAVLEKETSNMIEPMNEIVISDKSPDLKLREYAKQRMKEINRIANNHKAFKSGFINNDKVIYTVRKRFDKIDEKLIKNIIKEGIDKEVFNINNCELISKNITYSLRSMEIDFIINNFDDNCQKQLDVYFDMIYNGLK